MAGGKGKSTGGKAGPKETTPHKQKSHSAKAGLQVSIKVLTAHLSFLSMAGLSSASRLKSEQNSYLGSVGHHESDRA